MLKSKGKAQEVQLAPFNKKLFLRSVRDLDKFITGKPSSYTVTTFKEGAVSPAEVKAARKATHLSQSVFASALGVSPMTLRSWEAGRRRPRGIESKVLKAITIEPKFAAVFAGI